MESNDLLVLVHLLLLVFWLGTDVGVFSLGKFAQSDAYTVDQRLLLLKIALLLDMFPRISMVLMLPTGLQLAVNGGLVDVAPTTVFVVWLLSAGWLGVVVLEFARRGKPGSEGTKRSERGFQYIVVIGLGWLALVSLFGNGPVSSSWLAMKMLGYATIIVIVILLERVFVPVVAGFAQLASAGSSPDLETRIRRGMDRTYFWVLIIYAILIASTVLAIAKPTFG